MSDESQESGESCTASSAPPVNRERLTTGRWRLGGISTRAELAEWVECGVIDAYRAGVLKAAGLTPLDLVGLTDDEGRSVGEAFALGELGIFDVVALVTKRRGT